MQQDRKENKKLKVYLLLDIMENKNVSRSDLAKKLGISYNSLVLRLKKRIPFKVPEVNIIKNYLDLTEEQILDIFFN